MKTSNPKNPQKSGLPYQESEPPPPLPIYFFLLRILIHSIYLYSVNEVSLTTEKEFKRKHFRKKYPLWCLSQIKEKWRKLTQDSTGMMQKWG